MKKKINIPKIGLRNIKTGIAVLFCLISYAFANFLAERLALSGVVLPEVARTLISKDTAIYACLAAVVVMGSSVSKSFRSGVSRIIGTVFGGFLGSLYLHAGRYVNFDDLAFILIPVGLIVLIYFLTIIKEQDAVVIAAATYLIIVITVDSGAPLLYALNRTLSTCYGVIVSLCVNNLIVKPKNEEKTENEQEK